MESPAILELVGKYADTDAVIAAVTAEDYDKASALVQEAIGKICAEETDDDVCITTVNYLLIAMQYHVLYAAMEARSLDLSADYDDAQAMRKEYAQFHADETVGDAAWLYEIRGEMPVPAKEQKPHFFRMLKALALDAGDFDDMPAPDVAVPKVQEKAYGEAVLMTVANADITEDGGLRADLNPLGKDFVLHDSDGCVYHLSGLRRSDVPGGLDTEGGRHYAADGWIEGYTSQTPREIEFEIYSGGRYVFSWLWQEDDEPDARWSEYLAWGQNRMAERESRLRSLIAAYRK